MVTNNLNTIPTYKRNLIKWDAFLMFSDIENVGNKIARLRTDISKPPCDKIVLF